MRKRFPSLRSRGGRTKMKDDAENGQENYYGMQIRKNKKGLSPIKYWNKELYQQPEVI